MKKQALVIIMLMFLSLGITTGQEKKQIIASDYDNSEVPMADKFREDGKIYVLTGVVMIILIGTLGYLVVIDSKVGKLEKTIKQER